MQQYTASIKQQAKLLGFDACGVAKAGFLEKHEPAFRNYIKNNRHGGMTYLERNIEKRLDPQLLVPHAKSVIVVLMNYYPPKKQDENRDTLLIAKYAYGTDYHIVMKQKLFQLLDFVKKITDNKTNGRCFVDSAPVLETTWAARAGLGWIGKNNCLIHPQLGSYIFIGELIVDLALSYDTPLETRCGKCTRCIDACPTNALVAPYSMNANRCLSYLTIELRDTIPERFKNQMQNRIFGCDICLDVCPYNQKPKAHDTPEFLPHSQLLRMQRNDWLELSKNCYNKIFGKSAVGRIKYDGLMQNIQFVCNK